MIDARSGFAKDGAKNRLREQDIRRVFDAWETLENLEANGNLDDKEETIPHFARFVPYTEITNERNDCNLNVSRYITPVDTEIQQDLYAHLKLNGGLPVHNMAASASYAVDSLRSASFTNTYGTTPCIMDYARFNYVAQPGDKGVRLTPPDLGIYDYFLVKWSYQPLLDAGNEWDEQATLEGWVDEKAGDPRYRYGRQQIYSRYDPSAIEEDLGDDPIKAGEYGIKNLKYILANINDWVTDDTDFTHREQLYKQIANQYYRYLMNVMYNVGGIYLTEVKDGTRGQRHVSVPKNVQKASLAWILKEFKSADWLNNKELTKNFSMAVDMTPVLQKRLLDQLERLTGNILLSAHLSSNPYTVQEYLTDLYNGAFDSTIKGRKLTEGDKMLQRFIVDVSSSPWGK